MQIEWRKSDCALNKSDFEKIERTKGIVLPDDFKSLIGPINGSRLRDGYIDHPELGEIAYSGNLSLLDSSKVNVWEINEMIFDDENIIPFGDVGNGDYICLDLKDGRIYMWEHEVDVIYFLYDGFSEMMGSLVQE